METNTVILELVEYNRLKEIERNRDQIEVITGTGWGSPWYKYYGRDEMFRTISGTNLTLTQENEKLRLNQKTETIVVASFGKRIKFLFTGRL